MTLDGTTGGLATAGALTLNANRGITLRAELTALGDVVARADFDSDGIGDFAATDINAGANKVTVSGVNVHTGNILIADTAILDGALTGSKVRVKQLTLTGPSADLTGAINGVFGPPAAELVNMPDGPAHKFNGCSKFQCVEKRSPDTNGAGRFFGTVDPIIQVTVGGRIGSVALLKMTSGNARYGATLATRGGMPPRAQRVEERPDQDLKETNCPNDGGGSALHSGGGCSGGSGGGGS